jgi:DNA-binding XRE family transcriptional regulator
LAVIYALIGGPFKAPGGIFRGKATIMRNQAWVEQGRKLREMRSRLGLCREEVCGILDISVSTLSNVEIGCQNVGKKTRGKLMRLYTSSPQLVGRSLSSSRQRGLFTSPNRSGNKPMAVPREALSLLPDSRALWLDDIARIVAAPEFARKLDKMIDLLDIDRVDACYTLLESELRKIRKTPIWGLY